MKTLTREALLGASAKVPSEIVPVPEFGGQVIVRGMTAKEQETFYESLSKKKNNKPDDEIEDPDLNYKIVVRCIVDAKSKRIFEDGEFTLIRDWPGAAFQRVLRAVHRVKGMGVESGNSSATAVGASSSA